MNAAETRAPIPPQLLRSRVIAVLRAGTPRRVRPVAETLVNAGIECLELTLTIPGACDLLADLAGAVPDGVVLGAGTITTAGEARQALAAGAQFLVSPAVVPDVIDVAVAAGVACFPGAWTPTEVLDAWRAGPAAVKLFPAASGGPAHLRRVRDPLPHVPLIPTGGVGTGDVPAYLAAGAVAVGVGGPLIGDALDGGDLAALRDRARALLDTARGAR